MYTSATKLTLAILAVSFLFGLTGCSVVPVKSTTPNMVDYSYVPATQQITVLSPSGGIESY
jgi:hypothetical protein